MMRLRAVGLLLLVAAQGVAAQGVAAQGVTEQGMTEQSPPNDLTASIQAHESEAPATLIARAGFVLAPAITQVRLAPDGRHVAWLQREASGARLHVMDTRTQAITPLFNSSHLTGIQWTRDSDTILLDLGSAIGALALARPALPSWLAVLDPAQDDYFIAPPDGLAASIFVVRRPLEGGFALERVNLQGETEPVIVTPDRIEDALAATDGESVLVRTSTASGQHVSRVRAGSGTVLFSCAVLETCDLLAWDDAAETIWLRSNRGSDLISLQRFSMRDGAVATLHTDPAGTVDLSGLAFMNGLPAIAQYHEGTLHNYSVDASLATHLQRIAARFPASNITPAVSNDATLWLLQEDSAVLQFSRYHLYDSITGSFTEILQQQRQPGELPATELSRRLPLQYRASDGLLLHGYVSLPRGLPLAQAPMVALIHGGPLGRIHSGFDSVVQFLVNRGYIVFEPNFRASTGYGRHYMESAQRQFGDGRVQRDIVEGVEFLLAQGIGNPAALGIMGHSFGGFSVLAGLAFTPDLFKAGFASAPPAAMGLTLRHQMTDERRADADPVQLALSDLLFGNAEDAIAMQTLDSKAPLAALAAIEAPLLLLAGADDAQVPISHVKDYSLSLLGLDKSLALLIDEDQGHGIGQSDAATRQEYLYLAETFLGTYLGGKVQPGDESMEKAIAAKLLLNTLTGFPP